jgi:hypothetical protein
LAHANVDAILVGEALVTSNDISAKVRELSSTTIPAESGREAEGSIREKL